jgi:hypothetical protein
MKIVAVYFSSSPDDGIWLFFFFSFFLVSPGAWERYILFLNISFRSSDLALARIIKVRDGRRDWTQFAADISGSNYLSSSQFFFLNLASFFKVNHNISQVHKCSFQINCAQCTFHFYFLKWTQASQKFFMRLYYISLNEKYSCVCVIAVWRADEVFIYPVLSDIRPGWRCNW